MLFFIFMRSTIHTGLSTYLPLFFINFRNAEPAFASMLVSCFYLAVLPVLMSVLCSATGLAHAVLFWVLYYAVFQLSGYCQCTHPAAVLAAVVLAGFSIIGSFATTTILAQTMLPNNVGMQRADNRIQRRHGRIWRYHTWLFSDNYGLPFVMNLMTVLPVIATLTAFKIPVPPQMQK